LVIWWRAAGATTISRMQRLRRDPLTAGPGTPDLLAELPVTTALELPDARVSQNLGIAFGLVVRSMGLSRNVTAAFSSLRKGEVPQYTELLEDARRHAIDRMVANAKLLGANAIVSMRFDSSEMGNGLTEVVAYGTAVVVDRAG
jgi:uncharacterized protein YbjQ (UPF0145 family)